VGDKLMGEYVVGTQLLVIGMGTVLISLYLLSVFLRISGRFLSPEQANSSITRAENNLGEDENSNIKGVDTEMAENQNGSKELDTKKGAAIASAIYQCLDDAKRYKIISIKKQDKSWKN
jgi:Na+-transporting methylmalonyl-CoA/oxaloacetate decarboxylase gamma subunit